MVRSFSITPTRILGLKDGQSWFDSRDYPVQFYPPEDVVTIPNVTVSFPDFGKGNAYGYAVGVIGGGDPVESCMSVVTIPFQDWGPPDQPGITDTLADQVIGTIPGEADVALFRVNGLRTNTPDQVNSNTVPVAFEENQWVMCDGGTLFMEYYFPIVRMIWLRLANTLNVDGTRNVILTRKQSVQRVAYGYWRSGNNPNFSGWTYDGVNGRYGHLVKLIEAKGPVTAIGGVQRLRRNGPSPCSTTDTSDFASTYEIDIEIYPGRSDIAGTAIGGASGLGATSIGYADTDVKNDAAAATHTYTDKFIGIAPENEDTRHVFVAVSSYIGNQSGNRDLNSVTLGGVAMTEVVKNRGWFNSGTGSDHNALSAIYMLEVPSSITSATIVLNFSNSFWYSQIDVYSVYNLKSATPLETLNGNGIGTSNYSLDSSPFGVAMLVTSIYRPSSPLGSDGVTGIGNVFSELLTMVPAVRIVRRDRGWQMLNSASPLAISVVDTGTGSGKTASHVMASFNGTPGKRYEFSDSRPVDVAAASHAYNNMIIGEEPEVNNKRYVIAVIGLVSAATIDMGTVTCNGSAMTLLRKQRSIHGSSTTMSAVYGIELPTGTDADLVFNFTGGNAAASFVDVYTAYNLTSLTPVDSESTSGFSASYSGSINTGRYGFGIALGMVHDLAPSPLPTLTAFENTSPAFVGNSNATFIRSSGVTVAGSDSIGMTASASYLSNFMWMTFN